MLSRLELAGFKSFASKTVLAFPRGITAIVGPNGSGKSNVIDAIKWVLGERDGKSLRTAKTEDLIFSGSASKAGVGLAAVSIHFNNNSKIFPVDFLEVNVTRKAGRDGTSQYWLNRSEIHLKDVLEFFAVSRLGTRGLSIINQGASDVFVKAAPAERQAIIEEILGLKEYRLKKAEAERKLKSANFNLEKVKAMIDELSPHLKFFRKQLIRFEKRGELEDELKKLLTLFFSHKYAVIGDNLAQTDKAVSEIKKKTFQSRKDVAVALEKLKKAEVSRPESRKELETAMKRKDELAGVRSRLGRELGRIESRIEFSAAEVKSADDVARLVAEIKSVIADCLNSDHLPEVKSSLKLLVLKIDEFFKKGGTKSEAVLESEKRRIILELEKIESEIAGLSDLEKKRSLELDQYGEIFGRAYAELEDKKSGLRELETRRDKLLLEHDRFRMQTENLKSQAAEFGSFDDFIKPVAVPADFDSASSEKKIFKVRGELLTIGEIDEALFKEAKSVEERHAFLSSQAADLEKATSDLIILIGELDVKMKSDFASALKSINEEFEKFFKLIFGGGSAKMRVRKQEPRVKDDGGNGGDRGESGEKREELKKEVGVEIDINLPRKKIKSLEMLSGGEKSLVSIAALFALISVSPPPFLVLDEVDAALDDKNTARFAAILKEFSKKTQFLVVTHNRATMEVADVLYGVTMGEDGVSRILSLKLETA